VVADLCAVGSRPRYQSVGQWLPNCGDMSQAQAQAYIQNGYSFPASESDYDQDLIALIASERGGQAWEDAQANDEVYDRMTGIGWS